MPHQPEAASQIAPGEVVPKDEEWSYSGWGSLVPKSIIIQTQKYVLSNSRGAIKMSFPFQLWWNDAKGYVNKQEAWVSLAALNSKEIRH